MKEVEDKQSRIVIGWAVGGTFYLLRQERMKIKMNADVYHNGNNANVSTWEKYNSRISKLK